LAIILRTHLFTIRDYLIKKQIGKENKPKVNGPDDLIRLFKDNIPSELLINLVYSYAKSYAKRFAPDGKVAEINYYLTFDGTLKKNFQIYIRSETRNELLETYLPSNYYVSSYGCNSVTCVGRKISDFKNYRKAIEFLIEKNSFNFNTAEKVRLQVGPNDNFLSINFYFEKNKKKWTSRFSFDGKNVVDLSNKEVLKEIV